jgi:HAMP domain-containing protein
MPDSFALMQIIGELLHGERVFGENDRPPGIGDDEWQKVLRLEEEVESLRRCSDMLARGELSTPLPAFGPSAASLKSLQATLRHLVWQAGQVAKGDYSQRIVFFGELGAAFKGMVEELDETR